MGARRKKNVLFTSSTPYVAGAETNLVALLDTIDLKEFSPFCFFHPDSKIDKLAINNKVKFFPVVLPIFAKKNILNVLKITCWFSLFLLRHKIELIYINIPSDYKFFLKISKILKIPTIIHIHIDFDDCDLHYFRVDQADAILFPSKFLKNTVLKHSPWIPSEKCFYVHNAVDLDIFSPRSVSSLKKDLGLNSTLPVVGIVGQLKHIKGQHLFLRAVQSLIGQEVKAHFVIVGDDNVEKGKYLSFLKDMAEQLGIPEDVFFLGYRKDIPEIMSLCDLVVVPSLLEPFGRVVIEAMACGAPVVASSVGGIVEIFEDGNGGLFCKPNDAGDLAEKIKYFFDYPEWWEEQKEKALSNVQQFTQDKHTAAIERYLFQLIAGNQQ